jgi:hypothetical protein
MLQSTVVLVVLVVVGTQVLRLQNSSLAQPPQSTLTPQPSVVLPHWPDAHGLGALQVQLDPMHWL